MIVSHFSSILSKTLWGKPALGEELYSIGPVQLARCDSPMAHASAIERTVISHTQIGYGTEISPWGGVAVLISQLSCGLHL
jgi:hypothetical protein